MKKEINKATKPLFKRLGMAAMALLMVGSLAACSSNTATEPQAPAEPTPATEQVDSVDQKKIFVTPEWVKSVMDGGQPESENYVILEGSWGPLEAAESYNKAHIPGAFHMNTDDIEEETYWNIRIPEEVAAAFMKYGVDKDTTLIVYGPDSGSTRIAFAALWLGVENVKVIDGGLKAWEAAGYPVTTDVPEPTPVTDFKSPYPVHNEFIINLEDTQNQIASNKNFRLVSIRSLDEFLGKTSGYSYIENMGEPKGALWGHDEFDYYNEDGTFISEEQMATMLEEQGITKDNKIAFYCGTGWRATIPFLIAYENGWENVEIFDGGWYEWQMDPTNPVQAITPEEAVAQNIQK